MGFLDDVGFFLLFYSIDVNSQYEYIEYLRAKQTNMLFSFHEKNNEK